MSDFNIEFEDNNTRAFIQLKKDSRTIGILLLFSYIISLLLIKILNLDLIFFYIFWLPIFLIACLRKIRTVKSMQFSEIKINFLDKCLFTGLSAVLMTFSCIVILVILTPFLTDRAINEANSMSKLITAPILTGGILAPIIEEIIFRGFLLQYLRRYGMFFALLCSTALFLLMHGGGFPLIIIVVGFMCGLLMLVTNNVIYPIILHMIQNLGILADADKIVVSNNNYYSVKLMICYIILIIFLYFLCLKNIRTRAVLFDFLKDLKEMKLNKDIELKKLAVFWGTEGMLLFVIYFGIPLLMSLLSWIL